MSPVSIEGKLKVLEFPMLSMKRDRVVRANTALRFKLVQSEEDLEERAAVHPTYPHQGFDKEKLYGYDEAPSDCYGRAGSLFAYIDVRSKPEFKRKPADKQQKDRRALSPAQGRGGASHRARYKPKRPRRDEQTDILTRLTSRMKPGSWTTDLDEFKQVRDWRSFCFDFCFVCMQHPRERKPKTLPAVKGGVFLDCGLCPCPVFWLYRCPRHVRARMTQEKWAVTHEIRLVLRW
jgi:hypothetical protein